MPPGDSTPAGELLIRVLLVEDEPRLLNSLTRALHEEGHAVHKAASGDEGLSRAKSLLAGLNLELYVIIEYFTLEDVPRARDYEFSQFEKIWPRPGQRLAPNAKQRSLYGSLAR